MNRGAASNGAAHDTLTCRSLTELARPSLAMLALAAVLGGAPAQALSAPGPVIAAGGYHTCALSSAGAVQCWGENAHGELGTGTTTNSSTPVAVSGLASGVVAVATGRSHTCALTSAGALQCWGDNQFGQLGDGRQDTISRMPVAVSRLSGRVVAVAAGAYHTCALSSAGAVQCWGENAHGELGTGTTTNSSTPVAVSGLSSGVVAIATGKSHTCALTGAGALQCWGDNQFGQLGDGRQDAISRTPVAGSRLSGRVLAVAAGDFHTCALSSTGAVQCWGENAHGELGTGTTTNSSTPVAVSGLSRGVLAIAAGKSHTCALTGAGALQCWGDNQFGQLGDGRQHTFSRTPVAVSRLSSGVVAVAAGDFHTCARTSGGATECWGENTYGALGDGTTTNSSTPVAVSGLTAYLRSRDAGATDGAPPLRRFGRLPG